jgi:TonB family protein
LHILLVGGILILSPMTFRTPPDFSQVVQVNLVSMPMASPQAAITPQPVTPTAPPAALVEEIEDIPVSDPVTKPVAEIEKPKEKPKPKPAKPKEKPKAKPQVDASKAQAGERTQPGTADGNVEVQAPAGSLISGASVDNASFQYPYWFDLAWSKLAQNFRIPFAVDGKIEADVYFQVLKSGRIIENRVVKSSGIPRFDQACVEAVDRSGPFPPLPREFLDEIIGITVTFTNR